MLTFIFIAGGAILLVGLLFLVYAATQHSKKDETGRRTEASQPRTTPARTEGREP